MCDLLVSSENDNGGYIFQVVIATEAIYLNFLQQSINSYIVLNKPFGLRHDLQIYPLILFLASENMKINRQEDKFDSPQKVEQFLFCISKVFKKVPHGHQW